MTFRPISSVVSTFSGERQLRNRVRSQIRTSWRSVGLLFLPLMFGLSIASAQTYSDLYEFSGKADGCCPAYPSVMAQGEDGNLYGITTAGGANNLGLVFKITPTGAYSTLYSFDTVHGSTPVGGLTLGADGNLYGMAEEGGAHGFGNIFKITPSGTLTVIYDFTGAADGGFPVSPLTLSTDGTFHGTSYPGVAFKVTTKGVLSVLHTIPTTSYGPLLQASDGNYYGTTEFGGTFSAGTVYKIVGTKVTTLYNFDGPHGSFPIGGLVQGADGYLYGTTTAGGGTNAGVIFKISTTGVLSVVVSFDNVHTSGGYQAYAGLIAGNDGNLYGATIWGGQFGDGVIFKLTTTGAYSVLYSFQSVGTDGAYATPIQHTNGALFGLTKRGGTLSNGGIYSLNDGITPFVSLVATLGPVGKKVGILGQGFSGASSVTFNGTPASFKVTSDTYMTATVPSGETGIVTVTTSSGTLFSRQIFKVTPKVVSFAPSTGKAGDSVVITGVGLIQASTITVGGVKVMAYTVNSDKQLTIKVPAGAKTGKIAVTTPGGKSTSTAVFTVTP
jgi:uncharacterized repeat protein (TIGR03803 family)